MPFEIPDNLHPDCAPVAWLLGTWRGNGHGDYPTIDAFQFGQECIFTHDGRPFFHYMSRAWIVDAEGREGPRRRDRDRLPAPQGRRLPRAGAHPPHRASWRSGTAAAEIGTPRLELTTDAVARTQTAKDYTGGHRMYGMVEGDLLWAYDMAAMGQELQPHLWGRLVRQ